ncbi:O-antigen ligase family protein [Parasphingorhabdus sp. DH2-15]|uniref:O-antigen ligase family protein n=1 Tax=Parasphingorhabdus sp. DH2-15 TaxID=3444112 RepID=UPI003F6875CE
MASKTLNQNPVTGTQGLARLFDFHTVDRRTIAICFFFIVAALFGGGGSRFPLQEMLVYLSAIPGLFFIFSAANSPLRAQHLRRANWFIAALLLWVIVQLLPLPPAIWHILPGRTLLAEAAGLLGQNGDWRPISIDPEKTLASALYLIVPITAFWAISILSYDNQLRVIGCLIIVAVLHILVSIGQSLSGGESYYMYQTTHKGLPIGVFANRNHTALFMLLCMILLPALISNRLNIAPIFKQATYWGLALVFIIAIVATSSRAVTVLTFGILCFMALINIPTHHQRKGLWAIAFIAVSLLTLLLLAWWSNNLGNLQSLGERFGQEDDYRYEFWPETLKVMAHYFPIGSGIGTFDQAFRSQESLDIVGTHFVNHAHNDYIEIIIENGVIGLLILAAMFIGLCRSAFDVVKHYYQQKLLDLPILAVMGLLVIALHSLVDYPLRSLALAAVGGACAAICLAAAKGEYRQI